MSGRDNSKPIQIKHDIESQQDDFSEEIEDEMNESVPSDIPLNSEKDSPDQNKQTRFSVHD